MISLPFRRAKGDSIVAALYGTIVAQARSPEFYRDYGVPDTVAGRLDMVMLHLALVLRRLKGGAVDTQEVGQQVFNLFCRDIDHNFREMGVGDLAVPKQMRRVGEAFYGRAAAYEAALVADEAELAKGLTRNVYGAPAQGAERLATYVREVVRLLEVQNDFSRGDVKFPDPGAIATVKVEGRKQS
jgi:cytochrome b pre-mRNA-processing protein 3